MWEPERQEIIRQHDFYLEQAKKRLLSQFDNINQEVKYLENNIYQKAIQNFGPDDDEAMLYEKIRDDGIYYHMALEEMLTRTRLSIVAGMYYNFDKTIRNWIIKETRFHRPIGEEFNKSIWSPKFDCIQFFKKFEWDIRKCNFYEDLNLLRLVVNVYKHGYGDSYNVIIKKYSYLINSARDHNYCGYSDDIDLNIDETHIELFNNSIKRFWQLIPHNCVLNNYQLLPDTLKEAYEKDLNMSNSTPLKQGA